MSADRPPWAPTADEPEPKRCQNCGSQVSRRFTRVFGDNTDTVHACPSCATYRALSRQAPDAGGVGQ